MPPLLSRRGFVLSTAALGAWAFLPRRARAAAIQPETYFEVSLAGRPLEGPAFRDLWGERAVRILLGSAAGASNSMVYVARGGALLVDTATAPLGVRMLRDAALVGGPVGDAAARDGVHALVINTHHHADHTGGNWALSELGARPPVVAHHNAEPRIRAMLGRYRDQASGGVRAAQQMEEGPRRDMALESAEALAARAAELTEDDFAPTATIVEPIHEAVIGDRPVVAHHFGPGHTDNDLVIHLPEENVVHCGDLLFSGMHPYFADDSGATCRGWIDAVGKAIDLCDPDTTVIPGHGPVGDVSALRRQRDYLERLWAAVADEVGRGTTKEAAMQMSWPFMDGLERDQIRPRAIAAVYDEVLASR